MAASSALHSNSLPPNSESLQGLSSNPFTESDPSSNPPTYRHASKPNPLRKSSSAKTSTRHVARALSSCVNELNHWNPFQQFPESVSTHDFSTDAHSHAFSENAEKSKLVSCDSPSYFHFGEPMHQGIASEASDLQGLEKAASQANPQFSLTNPSNSHASSSDFTFPTLAIPEAFNATSREKTTEADTTELPHLHATSTFHDTPTLPSELGVIKRKASNSSSLGKNGSWRLSTFDSNVSCGIRRVADHPTSLTCPAPKAPVQANYYNLGNNLLEVLPECQPASEAWFGVCHRSASIVARMNNSNEVSNSNGIEKITTIGNNKGWRNRRKQISQALLRGLWRWREGLQGRKKKRRHGNEEGSSGGGSGKSSEIIGCAYMSDYTSEQCPFSASASQSKWSDLHHTSSSGELYYSSGGGNGSSSFRKSELRKKRQDMSTSLKISDVHPTDFSDDIAARWMSNEIQASNSDYGSELGYGGDEELGYDDFQVDDYEEEVECDEKPSSSSSSSIPPSSSSSSSKFVVDVLSVKVKKIERGKGMKSNNMEFPGNYFLDDRDLIKAESRSQQDSVFLETEFRFNSAVDSVLEGNLHYPSSTPHHRSHQHSHHGRMRKFHRMRRRRKHSSITDGINDDATNDVIGGRSTSAMRKDEFKCEEMAVESIEKKDSVI